MTPAQERFEHMVAMAMEAWDATTAPWVPMLGHDWRRNCRRDFEEAVRERLAQSAMVYEMEIGTQPTIPEGW